MNAIKGFTITELVVVIVILGIMAAFALPKFSRSAQSGHERDMKTQLQALHAASKIYKAQANEYFNDTGTDPQDMDDINTALDIALFSSDNTAFTYMSTDGNAYESTATWDNTIGLKVTQAALSSTNPCCSAGTCRVIQNCP